MEEQGGTESVAEGASRSVRVAVSVVKGRERAESAVVYSWAK
ncbi:hypothetical protein [Haladaptatus sp. T7]|nr:hypothetical protein [Haladaptatus sp. T7]